MTEDGRLLRMSHHYDGNRHGWYITYREDAYPKEARFFLHDEDHGVRVSYHHDRVPWEPTIVNFYKFGLKHGPYSFLYEDTSTIYLQEMWIEQCKVGEAASYSKDGFIRWYDTFDDQGDQIKTRWGFWENCRACEEVPYVKGKRKGRGGHFHEDTGTPSITRFWDDDLLQGRSKFITEEGKVFLVHIHKDNRTLDVVDKGGEEIIL